MATNLLKIHIQSTIITPKINFNYLKNPSLTTLLRNNNSNNNSSNNKRLTSFYSPKIKLFTINSSLSSSPTPPISKDDAILQAKTSLSAALQKPLNNPKLTGKIKKQKQARFRVEIPVIDDSPESLARLVFEIFGNNQVKRRGATVKMLLVWPNANTLGIGIRVFEGMSNGGIEHVELNSVMTVDNRILNSADVAVFLAPNSSQLTVMKLVSDNVDPRPLVLFNPNWAFEDEEGFGGSRNFVGSFDVIYAFLGLEVRGLLSKRKGVVFKFVRDGVVSGENWNVLVEEEEDGNRLKVVSRFKTRPSIIEVENVLYNLMAVNSPITKSAKFLKNLVSNVTGKKSS